MWNITTIMGSTTYYATCASEIKSRIAMAKATFIKNTNIFDSKLDLNSRIQGSNYCRATVEAQLCMVLKLGHFGR